jgi:hypothetical protein
MSEQQCAKCSNKTTLKKDGTPYKSCEKCRAYIKAYNQRPDVKEKRKVNWQKEKNNVDFIQKKNEKQCEYMKKRRQDPEFVKQEIVKMNEWLVRNGHETCKNPKLKILEIKNTRLEKE